MIKSAASVGVSAPGILHGASGIEAALYQTDSKYKKIWCGDEQLSHEKDKNKVAGQRIH